MGGVINEYIQQAVVPTVVAFIIYIIGLLIFTEIIKKLYFEISVRIVNKEKKIRYQITKNKRIFGNIVFYIGIPSILIYLLIQKAYAVGIPEYLSSVMKASVIFEERYVDPASVTMKFPQKKKNLIYIYMESMETTYMDKENGGLKEINYIPQLTSLAEENISFSDTDRVGGLYQTTGTSWTMGALLGSTTGVPYKLPIEGNSADQYGEFLPGIVSLGDVLEDNGYFNYFMCGSDAKFGGRELYFKEHGNYQIYDYHRAIEQGFIPKDYKVFWGMEDMKLYEYAKQTLTEIEKLQTPFNFTLLTVDSHHSDGYICELCEHRYPEQYANALACADNQIVDFLHWIKAQSWYKDTVVIITGDHRSMNKSFFEDVENSERRIYNCFINTKMEPKLVQNRMACTLDLFPTTLGALGVEIQGERLGLGTNLFSEQQTLLEEIGLEEFNNQTSSYSKYYTKKFIEGK